MNISEIGNKIFYAGVNNRTTELFEELWPIPNGVSYNSYVVVGDKVYQRAIALSSLTGLLQLSATGRLTISLSITWSLITLVPFKSFARNTPI